MENIRKFIGSKEFYKKVILMSIPLGLQQLVVSSMGIIDSLIVSWIGEVTAVGTAAQLETLCTSTAWAVAVGIGAFSVQFYGAKDYKNLKKSFGLNLIIAFIIGCLWLLLAAFFGKYIIGFYLDDYMIIKKGLSYLNIVMFSYVFSSLEFAFNLAYRNISKPQVSMYIGLFTMIINILVNYILVFGVLGFPKLGIKGSAIATLIAHFSGIIIHILYALYSKPPFIGSFKEMFTIDKNLINKILSKTFPIIINELFFGFGSTLFVKAFGILGTQTMEAYYVGAKISEVFYAFANGFQNAISAIIGTSLGAGELSRAKREGNHLIGMACILSLITFVMIYMGSPLIVSFFSLSSANVVKEATLIVQVFALRIALRFFIVIVYASLRAGGDNNAYIILDSGIMYLVGIPLAFISVSIFKIDTISLVFLICQIEHIVRIIVGIKRYNQNKWVVNLTKVIAS